MSWFTEYAAEAEKRRAEELAAAEREAAATGKERFDLATLERHLGRGSQAKREKDHRVNYYVLHPELRTLEAYAKLLLEQEPWEDAR